jgi:uncharacterized protein (TIGR03086 family)
MTEQRDPRPLLKAAFDQATAVLRTVGADDLRRPTPCTEFDVEALVRHLLGVAGRIAAVPTGTPLDAVPAIEPFLPVDPAAEFAARAERARGAWAGEDVLTREMDVPWGRHPGFVVAAGFAMEVTTHSWDLADAIGYRTPLDEALGEAVLGLARMVLPAGGREHLPFAIPVPVADDAPVYERLAAWLGRRPVAATATVTR